MKEIIPGIGAALIPALDQAFFACVLIDDNDVVRLFNQAAERLWGCSRDEVLGRLVHQLVPAELRAGHGSYIERNRKGGAPTVVCKSRRLQLRRNDGQLIWASFTLLRLDVGLRPHYLALANDVTEEVEIGRKLRLYLNAFNSANQPMALLDAERRINEVNRAFAKLFGYAPEEMLGKNPALLVTAPALEPEEFAKHQGFPWGREPVLHDAKARSKDGQPLWIRIFSSPIEDDDGGPFQGYSLDVVHNITKSRQLRDLERDVLQSLASNLPYIEQGKFICQRVREIAPDTMVSIMRVDDERRLRLWAADGLPGDYLQSIEGLLLGPDVGSCGSTAYSGIPSICCDIERDELWKKYVGLARRNGLRACWSFPIKLRNGEVAGTFAIYSSQPGEPSALHLNIIESCSHLCMLAMELEVSRIRMERLTHFDHLTGLPNLERLTAYIDELLQNRSTRSIALLSLGLDGFRDINEGLGHAVGDRVLMEVATRFQSKLDHPGFVSRAEGDIFVVVMPEQDVDSALQLAGQLQAVLGEPFDADGCPLRLTASVGISLYPQDSKERAALLAGAQKAMYEAKADGRGSRHFFSPGMNAHARERFLLGTALRKAIAEGKLHLLYQPQVRPDDGQLYGVEALARWSHPELGAIHPDRFIALAEDIGEIEALGHWVLREACRQMAAWQAEAVPVPVVSVNLSPLSFRDPGLADYVAAVLQDYSLDGKHLTVEITESASMALTDEMLQVVHALRALGVGLAVDDFGTGYSSLSNLAHLPVTEVKIDRSFIHRSPEDERLKFLVVAVIGMGNSLHLNVVAEGVETAEQRDLLLRHQCPVIQGYFYSPPLRPQELPAWLGRMQGGAVPESPSSSHTEGVMAMIEPAPPASAVSSLLITDVLEALPFGVSWARMPGAHIQYTNQAFDALVGYPSGHFRTADQLIDETYIHEQQRINLRGLWNNFELEPYAKSVVVLPEVEIDILSGGGQIRTAQHYGLILPELKLAVGIFQDVSHVKRYNQALKESALLDPLTGVANRRGLQERWREVVANERPIRLAFLMVDLDGFKPVNDTYGHPVGDELLRIIASRLQSVVRQSDMVCRLGGDEFGLLIEAPDNPVRMEEICQRIIDAVHEPIEIGEVSMHIAASIGGCLYPDQAQTKRELLQRADIALYRVKRSGKGRWGWWNEPVQPAAM